MNCQNCKIELKSDVLDFSLFARTFFLVCTNEKCLYYGILRKDYR